MLSQRNTLLTRTTRALGDADWTNDGQLQHEIEYLGHKITVDGIVPLRRHVDALLLQPHPQAEIAYSINDRNNEL